MARQVLRREAPAMSDVFAKLDGDTAAVGGIGHNSAGLTLDVEVRLFNSLSRFGDALDPDGRLILPVGATVADVCCRLGIPRDRIYLVLVNGRDVSPRLGEPVATGHLL